MPGTLASRVKFGNSAAVFECLKRRQRVGADHSMHRRMVAKWRNFSLPSGWLRTARLAPSEIAAEQNPRLVLASGTLPRHDEMVTEIDRFLIEIPRILALPIPALNIVFQTSQRLGHIAEHRKYRH